MKPNPFAKHANLNLYNTTLRDGEQRVHNNLAVTPSEMLLHAQQGIPIAAQSASHYYDGTDNPSFDMPAEMRRGVDPGDLWQLRRSTASKLKQAHDKDVHYYG